MERVIGIDLGTTNSCVAIVEGGVPMVIPGAGGQTLVPSIMAVTEQGRRLVGSLAKRQAITNAEHTVYAAKRLIGRKFSSQAVKQTMEMVPYRVVAGPNDDVRIVLRNQSFSVPEVSAAILQELKRMAEQYLHEPVNKAVLAVPAYFNDSQRQATKDAGRLAGLEVLRIINEPTAAGIAYGIGHSATRAQRIAIYDLGGGTFDISLLDLHGGVFEVLATAGDTFLGGEDFDKRLLDWLVFWFLKEHKVDPRQDRTALQRLKDAVERAKCDLSSSVEATIAVPFVISTGTSEPVHLKRTLTRAKLEELTEDLIERTIHICKNALAEAGVETHEIDAVILVGGMTRMPRVQMAVQDFFGRAALGGINPEEVVALGAALQGAALVEEVPSIALLDVASRGFGIVIAGGLCHRLIERNSALPCEAGHVFTTTRDNQTAVKILICEGESERAEDNELLGEFVLDGLRPAQKGEVEVDVRFGVSVDGTVTVTAKDLETGLQRSLVVSTGSGHGDKATESAVAHAQPYALELRHDEEFFKAQQRTERIINEIALLLPRAETAVGGSDLGMDAIKRARAAVERARIAIIRGEPVGLLDAQEALKRTVTMLKGVVASLRTG